MRQGDVFFAANPLWISVDQFQVRDEIEFVCGDPRYQSPETLRALVARLKGKHTAALDRHWALGRSRGNPECHSMGQDVLRPEGF